MTDSLDPALENLYDYTKFHIGLYSGVFVAIAAEIKFAELRLPDASAILLLLALFCLVLAGACGA